MSDKHTVRTDVECPRCDATFDAEVDISEEVAAARAEALEKRRAWAEWMMLSIEESHGLIGLSVAHGYLGNPNGAAKARECRERLGIKGETVSEILKELRALADASDGQTTAKER